MVPGMWDGVKYASTRNCARAQKPSSPRAEAERLQAHASHCLVLILVLVLVLVRSTVHERCTVRHAPRDVEEHAVRLQAHVSVALRHWEISSGFSLRVGRRVEERGGSITMREARSL